MQSISMNELADKWFKEKLPNTVKTSTMTTYLSCYRRFIAPCFGPQDVGTITNAQLSEFFNTVFNADAVNRSAKISPQTAGIVHIVCYNLFLFAKENGYIQTSPYYDIRKPTRRSTEKRVLTRNEQFNLERVCRYYMDYRVIGVLLSLYTGMRIGEICSLQWSDIDFKRQVINITKTVSRVTNFNGKNEIDGDSARRTIMQVRTPKTKSSSRIIPVPKFLMDRLTRLRPLNRHLYVVNNKNDNPMCPRMLTYLFKKIIKLADIDDANFHCLRHTFATRALESGMDIKTVSEVLGHSNHAITVDVYVHSLIDHKRIMMGKVQPLLTDTDIDYNAEYNAIKRIKTR